MSTVYSQTETVSTESFQPVVKSVLSSEGARTVHQTPTFADKYVKRQWAKEQIAGAFRVFSRLGWADGTAGHISLRGLFTEASIVHERTNFIRPSRRRIVLD